MCVELAEKQLKDCRIHFKMIIFSIFPKQFSNKGHCFVFQNLIFFKDYCKKQQQRNYVMTFHEKVMTANM